MKKIKTIFFALLFFAGGLSFANVQTDCVSVSLGIFDAYYNNGYSYAEAYQASNWAYEGCVSDGNYAGETATLN